MTTRRLFRAALVSLATAFIGAAPVHAALFGGDDVARKSVAEQEKRVDGLYARYDEIAARLAKLEAQVTSSSQPVLDLANQLQILREELRNLRGQLEVVSNGIEANAKRQRDMYVDLDTRLRRFEQGTPPAAAPGAAAPGAAAPATGALSSAPGAAVTAGAAAASANETQAYEAAQ